MRQPPEKTNYFVMAGQILINLGVILQMIGAKRMGTPHAELAVSTVQANLFAARVHRIAQTEEGQEAMQAAIKAVEDREEAMLNEAAEKASDEAGDISAEVRRRLAGAEKLH